VCEQTSLFVESNEFIITLLYAHGKEEKAEENELVCACLMHMNMNMCECVGVFMH